VIGDAALRKVVGPDALRPVARADLRAAVGGSRRFAGRALHLVEPCPQHLERLGLVLVLRLLVLLLHDEPAWQVRDANGAVRRVDGLAARSARPEDVDAKVLLVDPDVDLLGLRQHGHGRRRCVDAPGGFRGRDALHAVDSRFELQARKHPAARDRGARLLVAAEPGLVDAEDLHTPPVQLRITKIHAEKFGREECRLLAARARPHFQDRVALVRLVLREQHHLRPALQLRQPLARRLQLGLRQCPHLLVRRGVARHGFEITQLRPCLEQGTDALHDRGEFGILPGGADILLRLARAGARQDARQFLVASHQPFQLQFETHGSQPAR
jgi:hypothetical protein